MFSRSRSNGVSADAILIGIEGLTQTFSADEENRGMRLAMRWANEQGGIYGRRLLERSHPRMTGHPVAETLGNARRLVEEDQVFLLFNMGGIASPAIAAYAIKERIPYMFPHTGLLELNERYVFTSFPRYSGEARVMLEYLARERRVKRIAILYDTNAYGRYFLGRLNAHAREYGYEIVTVQPIAAFQPDDLTEELRTVRAASPDALVLALYPEQARKVLKARAELDWRDARFVTAGPLTDERYLLESGCCAEGTLGFCYYPDPMSSALPGVVRYREMMRWHFPDGTFNRYSLYGWVFGTLVIEGLQRAGDALDREKFIDAMESISSWDSGGVMPPVSFSASNHHGQRAGFIAELRNGRFCDLTGWIDTR